jgi:DNA-directed RNA polymerase specialized sigma24 family protein
VTAVTFLPCARLRCGKSWSIRFVVASDSSGGGDQVLVSLDDREPSARDVTEILEVDLALNKLAAEEPRLARVVECRYFAGLNEDETADALGVSVRTAQREWFRRGPGCEANSAGIVADESEQVAGGGRDS